MRPLVLGSAAVLLPLLPSCGARTGLLEPSPVDAATLADGANSALDDGPHAHHEGGEAGDGAVDGGSPPIMTCVETCAGKCSDGACLVEIASRQPSPYSIAVDGVSVYWTLGPDDGSPDSVVKAPISGGPRQTLVGGLSITSGDPFGLVVRGGAVYWSNAGQSFPDGTIMSVPALGGEPAVIVSGQYNPFGLAVDADHAYWASDISVQQVDLDGSHLIKLSPPDSDGPQAVAVDATHVYWTDFGLMRVLSAPIGGGAVATIASIRGNPWGIAVDATDVYWTSEGAEYGDDDGTVSKASKNGGAVTTLAREQDMPQSLAVDATRVYWTNNDSPGAIMSVPLAGGSPTTLAAAQDFPSALAVYRSAVFWVNTGPSGATRGGSVMELAPMCSAACP